MKDQKAAARFLREARRVLPSGDSRSLGPQPNCFDYRDAWPSQVWHVITVRLL